MDFILLSSPIKGLVKGVMMWSQILWEGLQILESSYDEFPTINWCKIIEQVAGVTPTYLVWTARGMTASINHFRCPYFKIELENFENFTPSLMEDL